MIVRRFQNNAVTLSGAYKAVSNHPLKSVYLDGVRLPAPPLVFTWAKLETCSQRRSERSHKRLWTLAFLNVSTGRHFFASTPAPAPKICSARFDRRAHTNAEPHFVEYVWLRIRVAFGVLSRLPAPTGDHLASLRGFIGDFLSGNPATCTAQPNRTWLSGGGLIGRLAFQPTLHGFHLFHHPRTLRF
ncbi:Hypothetical protein RG540_CH25040 [Neorhizobium galegae bv. orientalis str. HAMBI 540]|uniref:Uncharacterized protein n=1 Tax=Neorhizobium galegae bv. orientalis str. HAMBI 540 TaxID=1028800 RepID=A0A068SU99_NEOGA|nr:Hypothetical protein RG540_CH25040 [Neorhizobium galegae bv. orientalis str. HAMBI 540]